MIIDSEGRLFGRINLVDAITVAFFVALIPVAYASLLLFRPARPHIQSVSRAEPNKEDRRIANGLVIRMKLKVRGDHLTPGLRAFVDDVPAIGFTFESPASADVIVGDVPLGTHDLILYDGVQEVTRAPRAIVISPLPTAFVRVVGALVQMDRATADGLRERQRFDVDGQLAAEIIAIGPPEPDRHVIAADNLAVETSVSAAWRRSVMLRVFCEPDPDMPRCHVGAVTLGGADWPIIDVPGSNPRLKVQINDVAPDEPSHPAVARIRVVAADDARQRIRPGDRDIRGEVIDDRTAAVNDLRLLPGEAFEMTVHLGVDRARDGWRYKGRLLAPGEPFTFTGPSYVIAGSVASVIVDDR